MSEEQLAALVAKIKTDAALRENFKAIDDLDAAISLSEKAGFKISKEDLSSYLNDSSAALSDFELESLSGGNKVNSHTREPKYDCCDGYSPSTDNAKDPNYCRPSTGGNSQMVDLTC